MESSQKSGTCVACGRAVPLSKVGNVELHEGPPTQFHAPSAACRGSYVPPAAARARKYVIIAEDDLPPDVRALLGP